MKVAALVVDDPSPAIVSVAGSILVLVVAVVVSSRPFLASFLLFAEVAKLIDDPNQFVLIPIRNRFPIKPSG